MKIIEIMQKNSKYLILVVVGILCIMFSALSDNGDSLCTSTEKKLRTTLEMAEGVGDVDVMLTFDENNKVEGAIIVAEGAVDASGRKKIHDSAVAVLNLPNYKVQILIKKK